MLNKTSPNLKLCFIKIPHRATYIQWLWEDYTVGLSKHYFCRVIVFLMISEATWGCCHHHTSTTTVFSRLLKLLLLRHLAAAAASTLHPQSKFCFPGAQPCLLLQSSKPLKEKLKGLHGSSMGCLLLLCLRTDSWLVDNSCSEHKEVAVRGGTQGFQMAKTCPKQVHFWCDFTTFS